MRPSHSLFILIKSLTKSEKIYFKRFCAIYSKEKQNNYILLFNAISTQTVYDEQKIKSRFKSKKFTKQLHVLKNYLYKLIVKALRQFYCATDRHMMLKEQIIHASVLYKKKLFKESYKMVISAKKAAEMSQDLFGLAELTTLQKKLISELKCPRSEKLLNDIAEVENRIIEDIILLKKYTKIFDYLKSGFRLYTFGTIDEQFLEQAEKLNQHELFINEPNTNVCEVKQLYYICCFLLNLLQKSDVNLSNHFEKIICSFSENKQRINNISEDKVGCIFYIVIYYLQKNELNLAKDKLEIIQHCLLEKSEKYSDSSVSSIEMYFSIYDLILSIFAADTKRSFEIVEKIDRFCTSRVDNNSDRKMFFAFYFISLYYFLIEEYRLSLKYLSKLLKYSDNPETSNCTHILKFLYVLNYYELGELNHLEYFVSNTLRILRKDINSYEEQHTIYKLFFKILTSKTVKESDNLMELLKKAYSSTTGESELYNFQFFVIRIWIDAKLYNKKYIDILQQKL